MKQVICFIHFFIFSVVIFAAGSSEQIGDLDPRQPEPSGQLEIFSWWSGDEGPALEALINLYESSYPQVEVVNATVAGGSGINARAVLKTRMLGGTPPDSFQVHAGQELIGTWVDSERMVDLMPLFESEGWEKVFPRDLVRLLGTGDGIWSVPVNIHRSNVLWYIPGNLEKWGVQAPATWDDFFAIAEQLQAQGVVPLSMGVTWTTQHLWESVALSVLGEKEYNQLWIGKRSWTDELMYAVWQTFDKVLDFTNADAPSLSWQQATDMVVNEKAAFNIMGDWAAGYLSTTLGLEPGSDYGWAPSPGTSGQFMFLADSFGLPKDVPNLPATVAWLKLLGSREGSDAFNPLKGSISPRTDSDLSLYNAYAQSAAIDFQNDAIVGSLTHGVAANEVFMNGFSSIIEAFLKTRSVEDAVLISRDLAQESGIVTP